MTTLVLVLAVWVVVSALVGILLARLFGGISSGGADARRRKRDEHLPRPT